MKRESINLETIHRYIEHGKEEFYGCRLVGENVPQVATDVYRKCFFTDLRKYFRKENDISGRLMDFKALTDFEFVVLDTYLDTDIFDLRTYDMADVFVIEFTLKEKEEPKPEVTLFGRIIRYFK